MTEEFCNYKFRFGWWCSRTPNHDGPCALRPKWWNISPKAVRYYKDIAGF